MRKNNWSKLIFSFFTFFSISLLFLIFLFIIKESLPFFKDIGIIDFLKGKSWRSGTNLNYGLLPILLASIYSSFIAIVIATPISLSISLLIVGYISNRYKKYINNMLNLLSGIPSVIYGFLGLKVIVKFFENNLNMPTGESTLAGGILLALMIVPFITSVTVDKMEKTYSKYMEIATSLGLSKIYFLRTVILKDSLKNLLAGVLLGLGRAFGETMAVMMVIGNAPIMPKLLGKAQTIPSLIALEMGMAEVGSIHYHSLFAAGLVLMIINIIINLLFSIVSRSSNEEV